ncbi:peptidoglycan editing factor PgeF [Sulfurirhabdus autotrophica]|uniref:Purine nucleoside phosphorylase n=1 Tax=Sulfurirhabdus autotrophica TaxID=1706046 RepID=A0A4R3YEB8_9PROT|nr:peptidoglycan editing factor PgeF [Sulfurirhabdus autotrophica]TCV90426.1 hypothetical protein EDC63_101399 [Sulfurirhabdus autotrophica]
MNKASNELIIPDWDAPSTVKAIITTRNGGVSDAPYAEMNLGDHVGDASDAVNQNRAILRLLLPNEPVWLKQVHGVHVANADILADGVIEADACVSHSKNNVCAVMTADCLPVLLCDDAGTVVGAAHAGWRGLVSGVIECTVKSMHVPPVSLMAYLGPAIGPKRFEVGEEVRQAFMDHDAAAQDAFVPHGESKWLADIYLLARQRLAALGITRVYGGNFCTYTDNETFFSYRRDGVTGRMASLIWLSDDT